MTFVNEARLSRCCCWSPSLSNQASTEEKAPAVDHQEFKQLRKNTQERRRRIIFSNEGDDALYFLEAIPATAEKLFAAEPFL